MHFLRELYMGETLRVFDSDFVVKTVNGLPTLFEVFVDKHIEVEMSVTPLPEAVSAFAARILLSRHAPALPRIAGGVSEPRSEG